MTGQVVPVGLLSTYIRQLFENDPLLSDIWVEGEVSELFVSRAGHIYFTLRDAESQIKSVLFRGSAQRQRVLPVIGDQIAAHGRVSTYEKDGVYQLYVDVIERAGQGVLALQFEQLRQKLEAEGLFEPSRKRPLPPLPRFIGVVTSEQGSVWHDMQTVLRRRYPLAHLLLAPAAVQGESAPAAVVKAIDLIQRDGRAELMIVARGGGSAEDLSAFNDERIARAVFSSRIPVISAIGHETDWTIIDLVADLRAPTPSAAAELCAPPIESLYEIGRSLHDRAASAIYEMVRDYREEVALSGRRMEFHSPVLTLGRLRQELELTASRLRERRRIHLSPLRSALGNDQVQLQTAFASQMGLRRSAVAQASGVLTALDPHQVLRRGYAIVEAKAGAGLVTSAGQISPGDALSVRFHDGSAGVTVQDVDDRSGVRHNG